MKTKINTQSSARRIRRGGFTLIEMLLVLMILGVLAALVVPKFVGTGEKARVTAAKADISSISTALDAFELENGHYPRGKDGLKDLVSRPKDSPSWQQHLDTLPMDPWQHPYVYEYPGKHRPNSFDLYSMGPDGRPNTEDDIGNWMTSK